MSFLIIFFLFNNHVCVFLYSLFCIYFNWPNWELIVNHTSSVIRERSLCFKNGFYSHSCFDKTHPIITHTFFNLFCMLQKLSDSQKSHPSLVLTFFFFLNVCFAAFILLVYIIIIFNVLILFSSAQLFLRRKMKRVKLFWVNLS